MVFSDEVFDVNCTEILTAPSIANLYNFYCPQKALFEFDSKIISRQLLNHCSFIHGNVILLRF